VASSPVTMEANRRMKIPFLILAFAACPLAAQEGGIEVFTGETLYSSGTRVSLSEIWRSEEGLLRGSEDVPDPLHRRFEERRAVLGIDHGLRRGLTLSALVPHVSQELDSSVDKLKSSGPGDVALFAKHVFQRRDWQRSAIRSALIAGVEVPTGKTSERASGARLDPSLQPGSGSWDPFVGIATTLELDRLRLDAVAFYKENTEGAQDFEAGDRFTLGLKGRYHVLHTRYPGPTVGARIGLEWVHTARAEDGGESVLNSGGEELLLRLGANWHPRPDLDLSLDVGLPLYEDLRGEQLGLDKRIQFSLGWRF